MVSWDEIETDWANLPPGCTVLPLWVCLHDGELCAIRSDLLEQTVALEFDVHHLREENGLPEDFRFLLTVEGATSVRVSTFDYPVCVLPYVPSEENNRFADEYSAKWREESMSWKEFEAALSTDPLEIVEADIAETEGRVAIRMFGFLNGERYDDQHCKVYLRGRALSASRSDGQDFSLRQFMEMGNRYWESPGSDRRE